MWCTGGGFQVYKGDSNQQAMDEKGGGGEDNSTVAHMKNFLAAGRSRKIRPPRFPRSRRALLDGVAPPGR